MIDTELDRERFLLCQIIPCYTTISGCLELPDSSFLAMDITKSEFLKIGGYYGFPLNDRVVLS